MRFKRHGANDTFSLAGRLLLKLAFLATALLAAAALVPYAAAGNASLPAGEIVSQFPAPGPSPRGLAWDGEYLWVGDDSTVTIYKVDPVNGRVVSSFKATGTELRGLAWDGEDLWQADNAAMKLNRVDSVSGSVLSVIGAPLLRTEGSRAELGGLAWYGSLLWCGTVDGWSSRMDQVDPADGTVKCSYATMGYPRALATDGTFIWSATDNGGKRSGIVYRYNLADGLLVSQFDTPGLYPSGLAFDGRYLWCADRETGTIYRLTAELEARR